MATTKSIRKKRLSKNPEIGIPETRYFLSKEEFDVAVGTDFITHVNNATKTGKPYLVGLSHGISPSGAYDYIISQYHKIKNPELIKYTFVNSQLDSQRNLSGITDARKFIHVLYKRKLITRSQILGSSLERMEIKKYITEFNKGLGKYLKTEEKEGLDYVFLACTPHGRVAGIERDSSAFLSKDYSVLIENGDDIEMTVTPDFLSKTERIAFLATKSDKRRPLAWLYAVKPNPKTSPGFLRFIDEVDSKMTVFIDDSALTWPQLEITRQTEYGPSVVRIDTAVPYNPKTTEKLPVLIMLHGFLGLNSFDGLLAGISSKKAIACAMHYGSIPNDLPTEEYSNHITKNIESVIEYFGCRGHEVFMLDHSMGNIYMMMIERDLNNFPSTKKYLKGRIAANPFFGEETKHAILGFMDNVIMPALSYWTDLSTKTLLLSVRSVIPFDTKKSVRNRSINLTDWLIKKESSVREKIWVSVKNQILSLMSNLDSMPHLNRIPIERALNRLPAKIFAIQINSALEVSKSFDKLSALTNFKENEIPVLVLKSEKDGVAKFVERFYNKDNATIKDVTNLKEKDLFREHLYHMVFPEDATVIVENFIDKCVIKTNKN